MCACVQLKPMSQLRFDYDSSTIRRYHDAFDYDGSDRNYDMRSIRLRHDYDEKLAFHFLLASNWKQARAIRSSRIVVESNCNQGISVIHMLHLTVA